MRKRILLTTLLITFLGLTLFSLVTTNLSYRSLLENSKNFLRAQMNVFSADEFSNDTAGAQELSRQLGGARVTFLDLDGTVTGDSAGTEVGQARADREEVKIAMLNGEGASTRRSDTVGKDLLYFCKKFDDRMVRLAIETSSEWDVILNSLPTIAWFLAIDIVFCLIFTYFTTAYTLKPVEELAKKSRLSAPLETKYKELYPIAEILNRKNEEIERQMDVIKHEQARVASAQESKHEFISNITHEMNTPLTNIRMYCDFLQMPDLSAENKNHFLSNISRQAEKLGWFGEGFEKATRLETDIITLTPVEQELLPIILEAANQASPRAEAKGREIRLEGDRGIRVCVDGKWTLEAVFNLLDNAVKYGAQGSDILIRMSACELYACIEVCSEGNRIPEAERNTVFQRFYRGKQAAMLQEGVGLGLFLTRKIISDQGGYVSIDNYGENGNSFRIFVRRSGNGPGTEEEGGIARSVDAAGAL